MIGDRIKELRIRNNLTQIDLARKLQLSRSAVNAWEMGISVPSTQYIVELANLFKTSADYLLEIESEETVNISCLEPDEKELIARLLQYFSETKVLLALIKKRNIKFGPEDFEDIHAPVPELLLKLRDFKYSEPDITLKSCGEQKRHSGQKNKGNDRL